MLVTVNCTVFNVYKFFVYFINFCLSLLNIFVSVCNLYVTLDVLQSFQPNLYLLK